MIALYLSKSGIQAKRLSVRLCWGSIMVGMTSLFQVVVHFPINTVV